jgi:hypothetical protein
LKKTNGVALIVGLITLAVLLGFSATAVMRSTSESRLAQRYSDSVRAFWLAESGANIAMQRYTNCNMTGTTFSGTITARNVANGTLTTIGGYNGTYSTSNCTANCTINATGFVPATSPRVARSIRINITRIVDPGEPGSFYDNAIYAAGNLTTSIKGNGKFKVEGNLTYATNFTQSGNPGNVTGNVTQDPTIAPLFDLNFEALKALSIAQGNYHNSTQLSGPFPSSFWYNETAKIPNVVYMEGDLDLTGNDEVGGFFITQGQFIYNDTVNESEYNASLGGTVEVNGCIYAPGNFKVAGTVDIYGGVWIGGAGTMSGNPTVKYNATYMDAIRNLRADTITTVTSWTDTQNPYLLSN